MSGGANAKNGKERVTLHARIRTVVVDDSPFMGYSGNLVGRTQKRPLLMKKNEGGEHGALLGNTTGPGLRGHPQSRAQLGLWHRWYRGFVHGRASGAPGSAVVAGGLDPRTYPL